MNNINRFSFKSKIITCVSVVCLILMGNVFTKTSITQTINEDEYVKILDVRFELEYLFKTERPLEEPDSFIIWLEDDKFLTVLGRNTIYMIDSNSREKILETKDNFYIAHMALAGVNKIVVFIPESTDYGDYRIYKIRGPIEISKINGFMNY